MAYTSGTMGGVNGDFLPILDVDLVANDKWSIFDAAAGINAKVYRCHDAVNNVDFYVYVDNNSISIAEIELWEDWDEVGHAGVGDSLTRVNGVTMRFEFGPGDGYGLCVSDHRMIFINYTDYRGWYVGQVDRFDTTKNMPIYIGNNSSLLNALGHHDDGGISGQWEALWDEDGNVGERLQPYYEASGDLYRKTIAGTYWVQELPVYNVSTDKLLGTLEGVGGYGYNLDNGLNNGDKITISGVEWIALGGGDKWCFVRKS